MKEPGATPVAPGSARTEAPAGAPDEIRVLSYFFAFFFFDFLKPTLPALGSYGRCASCICFVELALSTGESVTAVEPAALAGSDKDDEAGGGEEHLAKVRVHDRDPSLVGRSAMNDPRSGAGWNGGAKLSRQTGDRAPPGRTGRRQGGRPRRLLRSPTRTERDPHPELKSNPAEALPSAAEF